MSADQEILPVRSGGGTPTPQLRDPGVILIPKSIESAAAGSEFLIRELSGTTGAGANFVGGLQDAGRSLVSLDTLKSVGIRVIAPAGGCVVGGAIGFFFAGPPGAVAGCYTGVEATSALIVAEAVVNVGKAAYGTAHATYNAASTEGLERDFWAHEAGRGVGGLALAAVLHKAGKAIIRRQQGNTELEIPNALGNGKTINLVKVSELPDGTGVWGVKPLVANGTETALAATRPAGAIATRSLTLPPAVPVSSPAAVAAAALPPRATPSPSEALVRNQKLVHEVLDEVRAPKPNTGSLFERPPAPARDALVRLPESDRVTVLKEISRKDSTVAAYLLKDLNITNRALLLDAIGDVYARNPQAIETFGTFKQFAITGTEARGIYLRGVANNFNQSSHNVWDEGRFGAIPGAQAGTPIWPEGIATLPAVRPRAVSGGSENFPTIGEAQSQAGGFFIHAIAPYANPGGNQSFRGLPDWETKLNVVIGARPTLSVTHVVPGIRDADVWDGIGVVLVGGNVTSAGQGGTQQSGLTGRTGEAKSRQEVLRGLESNHAGWREANVSEPRVGALFISMGNDGVPMRPELVPGMMAKARELQLPLVAMKDGALHQVEFLGPGLPLRLGRTVDISELTARGETIPAGKRDETVRFVEREAPHIFLSQPAQVAQLLAAKKAETGFLELHPDKFASLGPSHDPLSKPFTEYLKALQIDSEKLDWVKRTENNVYFARGGKLYALVEGYSAREREGNVFLMRVEDKQIIGKLTIDFGMTPQRMKVAGAGGTFPRLPETETGNEFQYVQKLAQTLEYANSKESKAQAAFALHGYADAALKAGLQDVGSRARQLAVQEISEADYRSAVSQGLDAGGRIKPELFGFRK